MSAASTDDIKPCPTSPTVPIMCHFQKGLPVAGFTEGAAAFQPIPLSISSGPQALLHS